MSLDKRNVVEVWAENEVQGRLGSGYLVSERYVLTAAHVVVPCLKETDRKCQIRRLRTQEWVDARVQWCSPDLLDVALVEVTGTHEGWPPVSAMRWGRIVGSHPIPFMAVGFPDAQNRPDELRDTEQISGEIAPLTLENANRLALHVNSGSPTDRTLWRGMSGALVFVEDILVGLVVSTTANFDSDRVVATPVSALADSAEAAAVFAGASLQLVLEPVPAVPGFDEIFARVVD